MKMDLRNSVSQLENLKEVLQVEWIKQKRVYQVSVMFLNYFNLAFNLPLQEHWILLVAQTWSCVFLNLLLDSHRWPFSTAFQHWVCYHLPSPWISIYLTLRKPSLCSLMSLPTFPGIMAFPSPFRLLLLFPSPSVLPLLSPCSFSPSLSFLFPIFFFCLEEFLNSSIWPLKLYLSLQCRLPTSALGIIISGHHLSSAFMP